VSALIGLATGKPGLVTVTETGELYIAIPLVDWERIVKQATDANPCRQSERAACVAPGCQLARAVLTIADEVQS